MMVGIAGCGMQRDADAGAAMDRQFGAGFAIVAAAVRSALKLQVLGCEPAAPGGCQPPAGAEGGPVTDMQLGTNLAIVGVTTDRHRRRSGP